MTEADGRDITEILRAAAEHELDVLYLVGVDPLRDSPDAALARRALQNVGTVVVQSMELGRPGALRERLPAGCGVPRARGACERLGGAQPAGPSAAAAAGSSRPDWEIFAGLAAGRRWRSGLRHPGRTPRGDGPSVGAARGHGDRPPHSRRPRPPTG